MKTALILGISGQDGCYLADLLLKKGYRVHGTSRDVDSRSFVNLQRLGIADQVSLHSASLVDFRNLLQVITQVEPDEIYNLAGQTSVGLSFSQPMETMESIALGSLQVLEVMRYLNAPIRLYNAGSSECFGAVSEGAPSHEATPFHPRSPYAAAKAAAFWATANYREAYGLHACSGILFNHESPLRPARFVTRKIVATACSIAGGSKDKLRLGNMAIRRDWGWAPEYADAMWRMLQLDSPEDIVIATGESHSLEEFVALVFQTLDLDWREHVEVDESLYRPSDLMFSEGDPSRAFERLGWKAEVHFAELIRRLVEAELKSSKLQVAS
ncbi:GDP-mannose 4,6-dehydratase [Mariprofundus ferrooxydans]|uniref:GDP-mannose 4,6-dehydratase n=1 Tax=Mariprofundus ferrooxydans TaxID=314344 RepID=UPI0014321085|nr:GDP-mannose 4,6-dehydratase [Mariprofundus ferrooxydans]